MSLNEKIEGKIPMMDTEKGEGIGTYIDKFLEVLYQRNNTVKDLSLVIDVHREPENNYVKLYKYEDSDDLKEKIRKHYSASC